MQREGDILMKKHNMRDGFSMIMAIFVIVIMASIGAFVMNISSKMTKTTTAQYQHEQAVLYAKSYTEYAVLAITGHDRGVNGCLKEVDGTIGTPTTTGDGYRIRTYISYIGKASAIGTCPSARILSTNVTTNSTLVTAIIDVYVQYQDPDHTASGANAPWFTVHRRTVQKI